MTHFSRLDFCHEKVSVGGVQKPWKKKWKKVVETENFFRPKSVMKYFSLSFLFPCNYSFPPFFLFPFLLHVHGERIILRGFQKESVAFAMFSYV